MRVRAIFELIRETFEAWTNDGAERLGAAFAYSALFSMTPMLVVAIVITTDYTKFTCLSLRSAPAG